MSYRCSILLYFKHNKSGGSRWPDPAVFEWNIYSEILFWVEGVGTKSRVSILITSQLSISAFFASKTNISPLLNSGRAGQDANILFYSQQKFICGLEMVLKNIFFLRPFIVMSRLKVGLRLGQTIINIVLQ